MTVNNKVLGIENATSEGTIDLEKGSSGLFWFYQKNGSRVYIVLAKNTAQVDNDIVATTGIPQIGTLVDGAPVRRLKAKEVDRISRHPSTGAATILWSVTVETDSRFDPNQISDDPTDIRPKRRWYTEKENERIEVDINNTILETSALEPLNVEWPMVNMILEIERYEEYPTDPSLIYAFVQHTNVASFYGAEIGSVLLDDIQSEEEVINGVTFCKLRYVFKFVLRYDEEHDSFKENTVRVKEFLNQGYMYRPTADAKPITYLDGHGHPVKVNLKLDGTLLGEDDDPVFTDWDMVPYADFGTLNLEF